MEVLGDKHIAALAFMVKKARSKTINYRYYQTIEIFLGRVEADFMEDFYTCIYINDFDTSQKSRRSDIVKSFRTISRRFTPLYKRNIPELCRYLTKHGNKRTN